MNHIITIFNEDTNKRFYQQNNITKQKAAWNLSTVVS